MDADRFDQLLRHLANRRGALGVGGLVALLTATPAAGRGGKHDKAGGKDKGKGKPKDKPKGCKTGQKKCGGACTNTGTDFFNCGTCGNVCSSGAGSLCCAGECINTGTDLRHCGGCGRPCDGADAACIDGLCTRCPENQTRCPNGTCADTVTDAKNCGACGTACPENETCQNSICTCPGPKCAVPGGGDRRCCPATGGVCCSNGRCCPSGQECLEGGRCCDVGSALCADGRCCPPGYSCGGLCGQECCLF